MSLIRANIRESLGKNNLSLIHSELGNGSTFRRSWNPHSQLSEITGLMCQSKATKILDITIKGIETEGIILWLWVTMVHHSWVTSAVMVSTSLKCSREWEGKLQRWAAQMVEAMEWLPDEVRLRSLRLFWDLVKEKGWKKDITGVCKIVQVEDQVRTESSLKEAWLKVH